VTCACCPAVVATPSGWVEVKEWQGNGMVLVTKPLCSRCKALIVATGKGEIINKEQVKQ
jgi:hypothetical protein